MISDARFVTPCIVVIIAGLKDEDLHCSFRTKF